MSPYSVSVNKVESTIGERFLGNWRPMVDISRSVALKHLGRHDDIVVGDRV